MTIKMKNNYAEHFNPVHWCEHQYLAFFILLSTSCIDAAIFYSLFEDISYDAPLLIAVMELAFVLAFDLLPFMLGIQSRIMQFQGKSNKFVICFSLFATLAAFVLNMVIRIMSLAGTSVDTMLADTGNLDAYSVVILSCVLPMITSIVGFTASYYTFDYKQAMLKKYKKLIASREEQLHNVQSLIHEYEMTANHKEFLTKQDVEAYQQAKAMHRILALRYCTYIRAKLMKRMKDPASVTALSADCSKQVMIEYEKKIAAADIPDIAEVAKCA